MFHALQLIVFFISACVKLAWQCGWVQLARACIGSLLHGHVRSVCLIVE